MGDIFDQNPDLLGKKSPGEKQPEAAPELNTERGGSPVARAPGFKSVSKSDLRLFVDYNTGGGENDSHIEAQDRQREIENQELALDQGKTHLRGIDYDENPETPEQAAAIDKLARKTGLPRITVRNNFAELSKRVEQHESQGKEVNFPEFANWVKKKEGRYEKAKKDWEALGWLGRIATSIKKTYFSERAGANYDRFIQAQEDVATEEKRKQEFKTKLDKHTEAKMGIGDSTLAQTRFDPTRNSAITGKTRQYYDSRVGQANYVMRKHLLTALDYYQRGKVLPSSPTLQRIGEASTFWQAAKRFAESPFTATVEGLASSAWPILKTLATSTPFAIAGPVGLGVGTFTGSSTTNFNSKLAEKVAEHFQGKDFTAEDVVKLFKDEKAKRRIIGEANRYALGTGIGEGAAAFFAPFRIFRGTGANIAAQTAIQATGGGAGEALGQYLEKGKVYSPGEVFLEFALEIPGSLPEIAIGQTIGRLSLAKKKRVTAAIVSATRAGTLRQMVDHANDAEMRELDREDFASYVNEVFGDEDYDSDISIGTDEIDQFFQQTPEAEAALAEAAPQLYERYKQAKASGGDLVLTLPEYLTHLADQHEKLEQFIRIGDTKLTVGEARKVIAKSDEQYRKVLSEIQQGVEVNADRTEQLAAIMRDVRQQLIDTYGLAPDVAEENARIYVQQVDTYSQVAGHDPQLFHESMQVGMASEFLAKQQAGNRDALLKAVREFKPAASRTLYGPTLTEAMTEAGVIKGPDDYGNVKPGSKKWKKLADAIKEQGFAPAEATDEDILNLIAQDQTNESVYADKNVDQRRAQMDEALRQLREIFEQEGVDLTNDEAANALIDKLFDNAKVDEDGVILFQYDLDLAEETEVFYSALQKTLDEKLPGKGTPEQFIQAIQAFQKKGLFTQDELDYVGVIDWLQNGGQEEISRLEAIRIANREPVFYSFINSHALPVRLPDGRELFPGNVYEVRKGDLEILQNEGHLGLFSFHKNPFTGGKITKADVMDFVEANVVEFDVDYKTVDGGGRMDPSLIDLDQGVYVGDYEIDSEAAAENANELRTDWEEEARSEEDYEDYYAEARDEVDEEDYIDENGELDEDGYDEAIREIADERHAEAIEEFVDSRYNDFLEDSDNFYQDANVYATDGDGNRVTTEYVVRALPYFEGYEVLDDFLQYHRTFREEDEALQYIESALYENGEGDYASNYNEDYGVNSQGHGAVKHEGVNIGGPFTNYGEILLRIDDLPGVPFYARGHWDEKNVIVHVRFDSRKTADGKDVLFIEEIQSDIHQQGRKKGYVGDAVRSIEEINVEMEDVRNQSDDIRRQIDRDVDAFNKEYREKHGADAADLRRKISAIKADLDTLEETGRDLANALPGKEFNAPAQLSLERNVLDVFRVAVFGDMRRLFRITDMTDIESRKFNFKKVWESAIDAMDNGEYGRTYGKLKEQLVENDVGAQFMADLRKVAERFFQEGMNLMRTEKRRRAASIAVENYAVGHPKQANLVELRQRFSGLTDELDKVQGLVTDAPFKQTKQWSLLAFKKMLSIAVENGVDYIGWTTGDQQADIWSSALQMQVQHVEVTKVGDDQYHLEALRQGQSQPSRIRRAAGRDMVQASANADDYIFTADQLSDYIGTEMTEMLLSDMDISGSDSAIAVGSDLKVGGQGMRRFYDKMLRNFISGYLKKAKPKFHDELMLAGGVDPVHAVEINDAMIEIGSVPQKLFQRDKKNRGHIRFPAEGLGHGQTTITMTKDMNLSTFLHESGHLFLETLRTIVAEQPNNEEARNMLKQVQGWWARNADHIYHLTKQNNPELAAQIDEAGGEDFIMNYIRLGTKPTDELERAVFTELHEYYARGFEAYMFEGKAPTPALRRMFQKFKDWLIRVYNTIRNLNVNLDDEIRAFFDRLIAGSEAVNMAAEEAELELMFASAAEAGVSEQEWQQLQNSVDEAIGDAKEAVHRNLMRAQQRERTARYNKEVAKTRKEVEVEINQMPVYQAIYFLQHGEFLTDDFGITIKPLKLSRDILVERYGPEILEQLPGRGSNSVWRSRAGKAYDMVDPNEVAEMFGYDSGDALIREMIDAPPRKAAIDAEAKYLVSQRLQDPMVDDSLLEDAEDAVAKSKERVLRAEQRVLNKRAGSQTSPVNTAKRVARESIGERKIMEVEKEHVYRNAESRARTAAQEAVHEENFEEAARQERIRLLNYYMHLEAVAANKQVIKDLQYLKKFGKASIRKRIDHEFLEQIDAIIERLILKKESDLAIQRRNQEVQSFEDFVANTPEIMDGTNFPDVMRSYAHAVSYRELSLNEFNAIIDQIKMLHHIGRDRRKLIAQEEAIAFEAAKDELITALYDNTREREGRGIDPNLVTKFQKLKKIGRGFDTALLGVEQLIDWLDGGVPDGPWRKYFWSVVAKAEHARNKMDAEITIKVVDQLEQLIGKDGTLKESAVYIPAMDQSFTKEALVAVALNLGNVSNKEKLMGGAFLVEGGERIQFTEEAIEQIKAALSKEDWDAIQGLWDTIQSLWPQIVEVELATTGLAPKQIEPETVVTPYGEYRGGYYPVKYDPEQSTAGEKQLEVGKPEMGYLRTPPPTGFTKGRVEGFAEPILLSLRVLPAHLSQVTHTITHKRAYRDIMKIIDNKEIGAAIRDRLGSEYLSMMRHWANAIGRNRLINDEATALINRFGDMLRSNATIAAMGFKYTTMVAQLAGIFSGIEIYLRPDAKGRKISTGYLMKALFDFYSHVPSTVDMVFELSGEMKNRMFNIDRDMREQYNRIAGKSGKLKSIQRASMAAIGIMDLGVSIPIWLGVYRWALDQGYTQDEAVQFADSRVRQSQGSGALKDMSAIQRNPKWKWFTMFYGYFKAMYGRERDLLRDMKRGNVSVGNIINRSFFLFVGGAVVAELLAGRGPDCKNSLEKGKCWSMWATGKTLGYVFATIPGVRDVANTLTTYFVDNKSFASSPTPLNSAANALVAATKGIVKWAETGESEKAVKGLVRAAGYFIGLPSAQAEITGGYLWDVLRGKVHDPNLIYFLIREPKR